MIGPSATAPVLSGLPRWVPDGARRYLAHTETGQSIRALARGAGCHASTVLRQVQRVETRRDDPLVDEVLRQLGRVLAPSPNPQEKEWMIMTEDVISPVVQPDSATLQREGKRILQRLSETGAVLAVADGMEKAVVVRDGAQGSLRTAVTDRAVARALALKEWVACSNPGRVSRYHITPTGRSVLKRMLAEDENRAQGFSEVQSPYAAQHASWGTCDAQDPDTGETRRMRLTSYDTPLAVLARRRDKEGKPFLDDDLVRAGERLREDFELAQMSGPRMTQDWARFLTAGTTHSYSGDDLRGYSPSAARARVTEALRDLGPGLGDVVLRCCCYLEGLENAEKKMGWSARSGKIVLRIALQRLKRHYAGIEGANGPLIG